MPKSPAVRTTGRLIRPKEVVCVECSCGVLSLIKRGDFESKAKGPPRCSNPTCNTPLVLSEENKRDLGNFVFESEHEAWTRFGR